MHYIRIDLRVSYLNQSPDHVTKSFQKPLRSSKSTSYFVIDPFRYCKVRIGLEAAAGSPFFCAAVALGFLAHLII
jgi:hypothetical protein